MDFIILTGMSGAGKTNALHALEDLGFYCMDNIPPALLSNFYDLCVNSADSRMKRVAVVADSRSGNIYFDLAEMLKAAKLEGKEFKILFLDSDNITLLKRYKETRRKHPLLSHFSSGSIEEAIALEDEIVKPIREMADYIVDTSDLSVSQAKERIQTIFSSASLNQFLVSCVSFGFKYGIPIESDIIFDVRCLPNPYYVPELKDKTGLDSDVRDYVMNSEVTEGFVKRLFEFLDYSIPLYKKEGKSELVIGVGCTGGKHRSVTISRLINAHLIENSVSSALHHRDIWKA